MKKGDDYCIFCLFLVKLLINLWFSWWFHWLCDDKCKKYVFRRRLELWLVICWWFVGDLLVILRLNHKKIFILWLVCLRLICFYFKIRLILKKWLILWCEVVYALVLFLNTCTFLLEYLYFLLFLFDWFFTHLYFGLFFLFCMYMRLGNVKETASERREAKPIYGCWQRVVKRSVRDAIPERTFQVWWYESLLRQQICRQIQVYEE